MKDTPVAGVVLAGGKSVRFGRDKAMLRVAATGKSLLEHTVDLLRPLFQPVLVSGRSVPYTLSCQDLFPRGGPLGGLVSVMTQLPGRPCCVLSCDMPRMNGEMLQRLLDRRNRRLPETLVTLYISPQGMLNPLAAIYEPEALPFLVEPLSQGLLSIWRSFPLPRQQRILYAECDAPAFSNLNSLQDYEEMVQQGILLGEASSCGG